MPRRWIFPVVVAALVLGGITRLAQQEGARLPPVDQPRSKPP